MEDSVRQALAGSPLLSPDPIAENTLNPQLVRDVVAFLRHSNDVPSDNSAEENEALLHQTAVELAGRIQDLWVDEVAAGADPHAALELVKAEVFLEAGLAAPAGLVDRADRAGAL